MIRVNCPHCGKSNYKKPLQLIDESNGHATTEPMCGHCGKTFVVRARISVDIVCEIGGEVSFQECLDQCAEEVKTWPKWKRELMGKLVEEAEEQ